MKFQTTEFCFDLRHWEFRLFPWISFYTRTELFFDNIGRSADKMTRVKVQIIQINVGWFLWGIGVEWAYPYSRKDP